VRVLALDQGTSATKAVVVDVDANRQGITVLAEVDVPVTGQRYDGDAVEQDPEALWRSILDAATAALRSVGGAGGVDCLGVGNQGETVLAWRRSSGEPLTPALVWQDRRAVSITERLQPWGQRLQQLTGLPLDPYFAAAKQTWVREQLLDAEQRDDADVVVTTIDAWVLNRLCGRAVTDAATASRTQLLDLDSTRWSSEACGAFGIDLASLPDVVACDEPLGDTHAFGSPLPVTGAVVDQQAALFAQGCRAAGESKCTYGTGAFLLANLGDTPHRSHNQLATSVAWATRDGDVRYCADGQVYTVGAAVRWLQRLGLIDEPADLDRVGGATPGSGGAVFVPSLAGVGAPRWVPEARGSFSGLSLSTTREHLVHAFVLGIAAQVTMLARAVEDDLGSPLTALRVDGGLTRSTLLMQAQADLLGAPVEVYPHACATALGVAGFALRGHAGAGAEEALVTGWQPDQVFEPAIPRDEAEETYGRWLAALDASIAESQP